MLFVPESDSKELLIGGGETGAITIWDTANYVTLATFYGHSKRILRFLPAPSAIGIKLRAHVLSVGSDSTICGINTEDSSLSYIFTGHGSKISSIHWRYSDDFLLVRSCNDQLHVWQLKTGHLDRIIKDEKEISDILSECDSNEIIDYNVLSCVDFKKTLTAYSISNYAMGNFF